MHIILGGTGHIGSATANALLTRGEAVTVVTRGRDKKETWERKGAKVAICDVLDVPALHAVLKTGRRLFLLNQPAPPSSDTDQEEQRTVNAILSALAGTHIEKVVALSTYGARAEKNCGDLSILYALEQSLAAQPIPATILRAAYLMSNWASQIDSARAEGVLHSMLPADRTLPMVAPEDVGQTAARLLMETKTEPARYYIEGPQRYSPNDVAMSLANALGRPVSTQVIAPDKLEDAFQRFGFSAQASKSYARMTRVTIETCERPENPMRGSVSIDDFFNFMVGIGRR